MYILSHYFYQIWLLQIITIKTIALAEKGQVESPPNLRYTVEWDSQKAFVCGPDIIVFRQKIIS